MDKALAVQQLHAAGRSRRDIARTLGIDRKTVARVLGERRKLAATPGPRAPINSLPHPDKSWLEFDASLTEILDTAAMVSVTLGQSQLERKAFDPNDISGAPLTLDETDIERSIATAPAGMRWVWQGRARRVGYEIPEPGILTLGDVELEPVDRRPFRRKNLGHYFGVPMHGASWLIEYAVKTQPTTSTPAITDPTDEQQEA